ncbi:group 1 glycosyl transferase [Caldimicrobium thiodismutans]|uniref:Group 1 glycosyl transferase n=1 Tax=Caldimicrobium thiodismutans TaxID=1653476 RepID=A0A0U5ASK0_9BACT|nr:glycosyltransferase [Caldimicrobium thiodismutans]BAU23921.1 group 1 glycosyl transferase [Caldimicrobium thiodismutans]
MKNLPKVSLFLDNRANRRNILQVLALDKAGLNPKIIVFKDFPKDHYLFKKGLGDKLIYLSKTRNEGFRKFSLKVLFELIKILRKENIKVVLTQRWRLVKYLVLAKLFYRDLKIIYHLVIGGRFERLRRRIFLRLISPFLDKLTVNSKALREEILRYRVFPKEKVEILYSAVDPKEFELSLSKEEARRRLGLQEEIFLFGMIAKFRKEKDQEGLIKTFAELLKEEVSAWLLLAGDGPNWEKCKSLTKALGIEDRVFFPGRIHLDEVPLWLKVLDVFVYATFREGMPMAVLEAMASGLPIIATSAEGLPDIFDTPLEIGRLVPIGDYSALKRAMKELYELSEEERKKLGENARKRLNEGFSPSALEEKTLSLFKELLNQNKS